MAVSRPLSPARSSSREAASDPCVGAACDDWPYLDEAVLRASRNQENPERETVQNESGGRVPTKKLDETVDDQDG